MKIRSDFVTNSSSSSFILAFRDESDYDAFAKYCDGLDYGAVTALMTRCRDKADKPMNEIKQDAIDHLRHWMTWEAANNYCKQHIDQSLDFHTKLMLEGELKKTPEYKAYIEKLLSETCFAEYVQRIEEAEFIIFDTIWDSNGGLLEYAIRNDLLRSFYPWFVYQEDIG